MEDYRIIPGVLLIVLGISALLHINAWAFVWPAILIYLGVRIMTGGRRDEMEKAGATQEVSEADTLNIDTVFGETNKKVTSQHFGGGKINFVFGGGEIDLREAKIDEGKTVELEVNDIFGGGKIIVPETWMVNTQVVGVMGGFGNRTTLPKKGEEKGRLIVKGAAVFGGGEVVN